MVESNATMQETYHYFTATEEDLGSYDPDEATGNPMKGLYGSPWYNDYDASKNVIPSALEWYYLGFNDLMINDPDVVGIDLAFNWTKLENALEDSASRSMHAVFTIVCHYPGEPLLLPSYLIDNPSLQLHTYDDFLGGGVSPDYGDPLLLKAIEQLISALGDRYDGDKRIASVHAGLLGYWGEWHTYPHEGWVPDESKRKVTQWYQNAFSTTKIQVRYPYEPALDAGFGLSDGSFAFNTLDGSANGNVEQSWYFWNQVKDHNATDSFWKNSFMSGETRPEIQGVVFEPDYPAGTYERQDFMECINTTHTSFMFHHDAFANQYEGPELENALFAHSRMGYNFIISKVSVGIPKNSLLAEINDGVVPTANDFDTVSVDVTIEQKGIAPFYYPLSLQLHCYDTNLNTAQIRTKRGVETIVEQNSYKTFTFINITHDCLSNLTFTLDSPHVYPDRPVQFAQRGRHNNETTTAASVSILNVPIPSHQNWIDAMEYYHVTTPAPTVAQSVGGSPTPTTVPSITPSSLPTNTNTIHLTPSPSPTMLTVAFASPTKYPTASPTKSHNLAPIHPPIAPTHRSNSTNAPTKAVDHAATTVPAPIYVAMNDTITDGVSETTVPHELSLAAQSSTTTNTTISLIVVIGSVICLVTALLLFRYYKKRIVRQKRFTLPRKDIKQTTCHRGMGLRITQTTENDGGVVDVTVAMRHVDNNVADDTSISLCHLDPPDLDYTDDDYHDYSTTVGTIHNNEEDVYHHDVHCPTTPTSTAIHKQNSTISSTTITNSAMNNRGNSITRMIQRVLHHHVGECVTTDNDTTINEKPNHNDNSNSKNDKEDDDIYFDP